MNFEQHAFISYAHIDNIELVEGRKGWVANLHRALEVRLTQFLGHHAEIWRDPKLSGNDLFADTLIERLKRVAILVSVVSPRYLQSEWTLRELTEFWHAAEQQGGIRIHNKARVFKVLKTPVPIERTPEELRALIGYEFFKVDPETGRVRELDEIFGPEAHRDFWMRLDDLAHDICDLLTELEAADPAPLLVPPSTAPAAAAGEAAAVSEAPAVASSNGKLAVYLAETTSDLREPREAIRRDLQQHGYLVLPDQTLPFVGESARAAVRDALARSRMSVHLIGRHYGLVPEDDTASIIEIQHELATERATSGRFARLIWIPSGLTVSDERQQKLVDRLRRDPRITQDADLLETPFEDLRGMIQQWLERDRTPPPPAAPAAVQPAQGTVLPRLYLIADQRDAELIRPWADALFEQGFEVIPPAFEGDEAEIREYHEENLAACDGVLIFYGSANEPWVRRKLRDVQKAPGYGRTKPHPVTGVCLVGARTGDKERFRTHEAIVAPQWDGFAADSLGDFIAQLKAAVV